VNRHRREKTVCDLTNRLDGEIHLLRPLLPAVLRMFVVQLKCVREVLSSVTIIKKKGRRTKHARVTVFKGKSGCPRFA
jgi:hypothetical protein